MLMNHANIAPARFSAVLEAAEAAGRAIPPAFPLDATVAVNPFLGQTGEDLASTAARLARVAGVRVTRTGAEYAAVFQAVADARKLAAKSTVQDWNQATNLVITGEAGGQIMGDWAQGEFQVAGQVAGTDYTCLPGLGLNAYLSTGGDAFYFPKNTDAEVEEAQKRLAALLVSPEVQVSFNLKKGSLPIRGDVDLAAANDCMKKGLEVLAGGNIVPSGDQAWSPDVHKQNEDLLVEFWKTDMAPDVAHAQWVSNLKSGL